MFSVMYDLNVHASQFSRNYLIEHMFTSECSMPFSMYCLCEAKLVPLASFLCVHIQSVPGGMCQTSGGCSLC